VGVGLPLKPLDKPKTTYEVGEVGVGAPNVSSTVHCIYSLL
jgi:hypothetical protein